VSRKGVSNKPQGKPNLPNRGEPEVESDSSKALASLKRELGFSSIQQELPGRVITERVLIAVIENENDVVAEAKGLMEAERTHLEETLRIQREHNEKDPNQREKREAKIFGRVQYKILILVATAGFVAMPFVNLAAASIFGMAGLMVFAASLLNGRDRTSDTEAMTDIINAIIKMFRKG